MTTNDSEISQLFQTLEDGYWAAFDDGSSDALERFIHPVRFLGCTSTGSPLSRTALLEKVAANKRKEQKRATIDLIRYIVIGDAAITLVSRDAGTGMKIVTHSWVCEDGKWLMIGGMSQEL